jgi:hypothetical protein
MKSLISYLLFALPVLSMAAICDDTYYLNSVSQVIWSGGNPKNLTLKKASEVKVDLSNLDIINPVVTYRVISRFEGSCTKAAKPILYKYKGLAKTAFIDTTQSDKLIQMFDSNTRVEAKTFDYWFGFFNSGTVLDSYLGRVNAKSEVFYNWYAAVYWTDSVRNTTSGLWSEVESHFYDLNGPGDSTALDHGLLDSSGLRNTVIDENHHSFFTVQFVKVTYKNEPPSRILSRKPASGFQARQTGNLVLIQPGEKQAVHGEQVSLYGMMGNKVATLHPTGYVYQWNGRTSQGAEAPTGVYFLQAGNRILGKFFYTR